MQCYAENSQKNQDQSTPSLQKIFLATRAGLIKLKGFIYIAQLLISLLTLPVIVQHAMTLLYCIRQPCIAIATVLII